MTVQLSYAVGAAKLLPLARLATRSMVQLSCAISRADALPI